MGAENNMNKTVGGTFPDSKYFDSVRHTPTRLALSATVSSYRGLRDIADLNLNSGVAQCGRNQGGPRPPRDIPWMPSVFA